MIKPRLAYVCFPDDFDNRIKNFKELLDFYLKVEGMSAAIIAEMGVEDDDFVIKVDKGFDSIHIPLNIVKEIIAENEGDESS